MKVRHSVQSEDREVVIPVIELNKL